MSTSKRSSVFKKRPLTTLVVLTSLLLQTACGTLLYPERRGQTGGKIDPGVAILDGLGLLLFVIPGIIAFAVDFSDGTIYLPPGKTADEARVIHVNPKNLTRTNTRRHHQKIHRQKRHAHRTRHENSPPAKRRPGR